MSLTVPETLLLFALHDDKGTVHSVAYLALDHALRAAVLAELKLRGHVQVRTAGDIRRNPQPPDRPKLPFLCDALDVLASARNPAPVSVWLEALAKGLPDLRSRVLAVLERRGILTHLERAGAVASGVAWPMTEGSAEAAARDELLASLDDPEVSPRLGLVTALTVACHLDAVVFGARQGDADARAQWVGERDAIVRTVIEEIARAEGQY
jgi:hypothetical protein